MSKGNVETVYEDMMWKARREGSFASFLVSQEPGEAVDAGRAMAMKDRVDHIIHDLDGAIVERNSYQDSHKLLLSPDDRYFQQARRS